MTRPEARKIAKALLKAGFKEATICESVKDGNIWVTALNRCWNVRTVNTVAEGQDLIQRERY